MEDYLWPTSKFRVLRGIIRMAFGKCPCCGESTPSGLCHVCNHRYAGGNVKRRHIANKARQLDRWLNPASKCNQLWGEGRYDKHWAMLDKGGN